MKLLTNERVMAALEGLLTNLRLNDANMIVYWARRIAEEVEWLSERQ